jgi:threonine dehydrogenase-like Zn-dependent dehydrogenase
MKALYLKEGKLELREIPKPVPEVGEVLIRVILTGVCNTDIELYRGYMDFEGIPGHEFVGTVEGAKNKKLIGKRVVGEINCGCGVCESCREGDPRHCIDRTVLGISNRNGSFAEYVTLPEENIIPIPDSISDREAVIVEPLAAAMQILTQVDIHKGMHTLVLGDGKLGILIAIALSVNEADITLLGHHPDRNRVILTDVSHVQSVNELRNENERFPIIIEATGNQEGFNTAIEFIEPKGTIVLKSTIADKTCFDVSSVVVNEVKIIGSRCGRFAPAIEILSSGKIKIPDGYIQKTFPLSKGIEAFEYAQKRGMLKILINPSL